MKLLDESGHFSFETNNCTDVTIDDALSLGNARAQMSCILYKYALSIYKMGKFQDSTSNR